MKENITRSDINLENVTDSKIALDESAIIDNLNLPGPSRIPHPVPDEIFYLPPSSNNLFVGREKLLDRLTELFTNYRNDPQPQHAPVVGIHGLSGSGKSALAFKFALQQGDFYPDGIIGIRADVETVDTDKPIVWARDFVSKIGTEIGQGDKSSASQLMQEFFREKQMLLILDGVPKDFSIQEMLPGGTRCCIIITSTDLAVLRSAGVRDDYLIEVGPFEETEALTHLTKLIDREISNTELPVAKNICKLAGYFPLAIHIRVHFNILAKADKL